MGKSLQLTQIIDIDLPSEHIHLIYKVFTSVLKFFFPYCRWTKFLMRKGYDAFFSGWKNGIAIEV